MWACADATYVSFADQVIEEGQSSVAFFSPELQLRHRLHISLPEDPEADTEHMVLPGAHQHQHPHNSVRHGGGSGTGQPSCIDSASVSHTVPTASVLVGTTGADSVEELFEDDDTASMVTMMATPAPRTLARGASECRPEVAKAPPSVAHTVAPAGKAGGSASGGGGSQRSVKEEAARIVRSWNKSMSPPNPRGGASTPNADLGMEYRPQHRPPRSSTPSRTPAQDLESQGNTDLPVTEWVITSAKRGVPSIKHKAAVRAHRRRWEHAIMYV